VRALGAQGVHLRTRRHDINGMACAVSRRATREGTLSLTVPLWFTAMMSPSILRSPAGGTLPSCQRFTPHGERASHRASENAACAVERVEGRETFWVAIRSCRPPRAAAGMAGANASAESTQAAAAAIIVFEEAMLTRSTLTDTRR
jgi:hypothetical protein